MSSAVHLHLGAHGTGAEGFHRFLAANRRVLSLAGFDLAYPGRGGAPGGRFDVAYPEPRHRGEAPGGFAGPIAERLAECRQAGRAIRGSDAPATLILSDPELPGRAMQLLSGHFYPAARRRARVLRMALGGGIDSVTLVVRPYVDLLAEVWRQVALDRPVPPFADHLAAFEHLSGGWPELVQALASGLSVPKVRVLIAPLAPHALMDSLAPGLPPPGRLAPVPLPLPVTDSAVAMIQRHYRLGARFAPGQRARILAFHASQPQSGAQPDLPGGFAEGLERRYAEDLGRLATMPEAELAGAGAGTLAAE